MKKDIETQLVEAIAAIAIRDQKINELEKENAQLHVKIKELLHERYSRKSEKIATEELPVVDEAVVTNEEAAEIQLIEEAISVSAYTRSKPKRKPIPKEYPREVIVHDLPEEQRVCSCGGAMHCIGEDTSEQLDYVPAKIKVLVHTKKKYGCRNCEIGVTAAVTNSFLPKCLAAPGLLSHVILSKYEDHMPLYRQEKMWQRFRDRIGSLYFM